MGSNSSDYIRAHNLLFTYFSNEEGSVENIVFARLVSGALPPANESVDGRNVRDAMADMGRQMYRELVNNPTAGGVQAAQAQAILNSIREIDPGMAAQMQAQPAPLRGVNTTIQNLQTLPEGGARPGIAATPLPMLPRGPTPI